MRGASVREERGVLTGTLSQAMGGQRNSAGEVDCAQGLGVTDEAHQLSRALSMRAETGVRQTSWKGSGRWKLLGGLRIGQGGVYSGYEDTGT